MLRRRLSFGLAACCIAGFTAFVGSAVAVPSTDIVISEYRTRGPNGGSDEFIELRNKSSSPVDISGWRVNASNAAGTVGTRATIPAGTVLAAGCAYLLTNTSTSGGPYSGPTPGDQTYSTGITDDGGIGVLRAAPDTTIVDQVGQSTGSAYKEGTPLAPTPSNLNQSYERTGKTQDTDNNSADFTYQTTAEPENRASACAGPPGDAAPSVASTTPPNNATNIPTSSDISITFSEPVSVSAATFSIDCAASGDHAFALSGGPTTYTLNPTADFAQGETCTVVTDAEGVSDADTNDPPDNMAGDHSFSFSTTPIGGLRIRDLQGASHVSPFDGRFVAGVPGVVTAVAGNGFYYQDPSPDGSVATSEAIFVFTSSAPTVVVGETVLVGGQVQEFRPGCFPSCDPLSGGFDNLSTTEIVSPAVTVTGTAALPPATIIGLFGRIPPTTVIDNDATGNVETSGSFDPTTDGIDFYESLEAMHVRLNAAIAVGPTNDFGEIPVLGDLGVLASIRTFRAGIVIRPNDFNPERVHLDDALTPGTPLMKVRDIFRGPLVGVMDYSFGNFKFLPKSWPDVFSGGLQREQTSSQSQRELAVATFNVENLDPLDPAAKFAALAGLIVNNLRSPDLIALEEVQDNNGPVNDAVTDASLTYSALIAAIQAAGGPTYQFRQVDPVDDQDGGEPGGNIRVGFLFRTDRGLSFVDRPGGTPSTPNAVDAGPGGDPQLRFSPGRIDPANAAFVASRKPLAGEFRFRGETLFVIANHFNSKGGDDPLFGRFQPPVRITEVQRHQQAQVVNDFVDDILALDRRANVVVLGDLNDFEFSETLEIVKGGVLRNLVDFLPKPERYTYVFEGNSQVLDHILVSGALFGGHEFDVVHVNAEFPDQQSDHDPSVARLELGDDD
jgi:predicted extracellular nuclease